MEIIIHVVDASNPQRDEQMYVVYETLKELGVQDKKIVTLFNKQDRVEEPGILRDFRADYVLKTAVKTGQGLEIVLHQCLKFIYTRLLKHEVQLFREIARDETNTP